MRRPKEKRAEEMARRIWTEWTVTAMRLLAVTLTATIGVVLVVAASARATVSIESFSTTMSSSQAGGHPDLITSLSLTNPGDPESAKNVIFEAPRGVFGNPNALSRCSDSDFAQTQCPPNSQAGLITLSANYSGNPNYLLGTAPIFDMVPRAGEPARFAFIVPTLDIPITIPVEVRSGSDYGLTFTVSEITQLSPLGSATLTFWGFPASAQHNAQRFGKGSPGNPAGCPGLATTECIGTPTATSIPVTPLIDNPTTCSGQPLITSLAVQSYQDPEELSHAHSQYPAMTGCESGTFKPVLSASLTTEETDAPSGLNLGFTVPQTLGETPSPSQAKAVTVELPTGLSVNPDAADGQTSCSDAQAGFGTEKAANCPDKAKIGTVSIGTPALDGPLTGSIYIGEPKPGNQYRLFLIVEGFGVRSKLIGSVVPDPQTGQLKASFENLPQVPFSDFEIHLFASDRGLIATPTTCGIYLVRAHFVPWNESVSGQTSDRNVSLQTGPGGTPCPAQVRPFHPRLVAGSSNPTAGAFSDFHLKLDRDDGDQFLGDVNFRMPPGFTGDLSGITYCSEGEIAAAAANSGRAEQEHGSCPTSSEVGTTNVAAGPGSHPFHAVGKMYLAGPFRGAPLSVVAVTPALAGPYDYGVVVVRVALHIDPETAQVSAVSDTVPSIIGGIPIRMRSIQVNIDKPEFTINPTNCSPFSVDSQGIGDQGTVTNFSSYFHAVNCAALGFKPSMRVRQVGSRGETRRSANPELIFDLNTRAGDANIKGLNVTLPNAFEIDQTHLGNLCTEKELTTTQCAGRQQIGEATTTTPLLDQPLSGPVYAVSGSGGLPRLAFVLDGQVDLLPRADTKTIKGSRLSTTVPVVPDAPIGHFHLVVFGGKRGYLANTRSLCTHTPVVRVNYMAQNGETTSQAIKVKAPCSKGNARHKRQSPASPAPLSAPASLSPALR